MDTTAAGIEAANDLHEVRDLADALAEMLNGQVAVAGRGIQLRELALISIATELRAQRLAAKMAEIEEPRLGVDLCRECGLPNGSHLGICSKSHMRGGRGEDARAAAAHEADDYFEGAEGREEYIVVARVKMSATSVKAARVRVEAALAQLPVAGVGALVTETAIHAAPVHEEEGPASPIERAAIAMCKMGLVEWEFQEDDRKDHFRKLAAAALTAGQEQG